MSEAKIPVSEEMATKVPKPPKDPRTPMVKMWEIQAIHRDEDGVEIARQRPRICTPEVAKRAMRENPQGWVVLRRDVPVRADMRRATIGDTKKFVPEEKKDRI